jgi:hypothetical protein
MSIADWFSPFQASDKKNVFYFGLGYNYVMRALVHLWFFSLVLFFHVSVYGVAVVNAGGDYSNLGLEQAGPPVGTVVFTPVEKAGLRQLVIYAWPKLAISASKDVPRSPAYFRVGATVEEVLTAMGRPTAVTRWSLFYGKSRIDFDPSQPVPVVQGYEIVDWPLLVIDP